MLAAQTSLSPNGLPINHIQVAAGTCFGLLVGPAYAVRSAARPPQPSQHQITLRTGISVVLNAAEEARWSVFNILTRNATLCNGEPRTQHSKSIVRPQPHSRDATGSSSAPSTCLGGGHQQLPAGGQAPSGSQNKGPLFGTDKPVVRVAQMPPPLLFWTG